MLLKLFQFELIAYFISCRHINPLPVIDTLNSLSRLIWIQLVVMRIHAPCGSHYSSYNRSSVNQILKTHCLFNWVHERKKFTTNKNRCFNLRDFIHRMRAFVCVFIGLFNWNNKNASNACKINRKRANIEYGPPSNYIFCVLLRFRSDPFVSVRQS